MKNDTPTPALGIPVSLLRPVSIWRWCSLRGAGARFVSLIISSLPLIPAVSAQSGQESAAVSAGLGTIEVRVINGRSGDYLETRVTGTGIPAGTFIWEAERLFVDLNGEYHVNKRLSFFANLRNINNGPKDMQRVGPETPEIARLTNRIRKSRYGHLASAERADNWDHAAGGSVRTPP